MSFSYRYDIGIFAALLALVYLACTPASVAGSDNTDHAQIDLAKLADGHEISTSMLAIPATKHIYRLDKALEFKTWVQPNDNNLEAPRQHSTTWLKATLSNSSEQALIRWLVLEPWRLKRVEAFFFRLDSTEILRKKTTGLVVPLKDRSVNNGKTIIPIELNAGESQELYLKVYSDSMPFLSIKNWDPVAYSQNLHQSRLYQVGLFAAILMLLAVLVLQFNTGLIITGLWLLVAFVFESEKDGFFSNYLLSFLEAYSANIRITAWILTEYLFLVTSVFLLGFKNHRSWRVFLALMFLPVLMIASLSFVLDGVMIRNLGILAASPYAISWLFMAGAVLRSRRPAELSLLVLLFAYWSFSTFLLLGYTFNFYYTSAFTAARIYNEILVALALILTYSWQQKHAITNANKALRLQEQASRKLLEETVESRTADLNSALVTAKLANTAKVNFLAQVSHDLRSPLTAILGYVQLQAAKAVNAAHANQIIQDSALYMKELVDGLLDYARGLAADEDELRDIYLIAFIDNLVNQVHIHAGHHGNYFQLKIENDLPTVVRCRSTALQRILINLLDNAAKYTHEGYISLSIAAKNGAEEQPLLVFRVSDTGCGITSEQLKQIYKPFFQGSKNSSGSGLGLVICFELTESLGGSLEVESELGKGTTVTCTIPYAAGDEQLASPSLPTLEEFLPAFDAQQQVAWVVEDSSQIREMLDTELSDMGFNTVLTASTEEFIELSTQRSARPAVIISDFQLPGANGDKVLHVARQRWPKVPVILLSATQHNKPPQRETAEQFSAYLSKPVDLLELRLTLAELCQLSPLA